MAHLLIIEDDNFLLSLMKALLSKTGHTITIAGNGKEGLALLDGWAPDLVITDLIMPEMDGLEMMAHLKKQFSDLKVMVISGGVLINTAENLQLAERLGAKRVLAKPFTVE